MQENKSHLMNFAMTGGFILGGFWILKYLFVIGSNAYPILNFVQSFFSIGTPLLLLYFLVKYKNNVVKGEIGFWHGMQFSIMLFFFASLLEAVIVIIHVIWIDPAFVANTYDKMFALAEAMPIDKRMIEMAKEQPTPTPFAYVFNMVMGNVLIGILLSLPIVPLAMRFRVNNG